MLSGVGIVCFASSYAVAWVLELSRLLFRSGVRGAVMLGFAAAGLVAHTAFLYYRAVNASGAPLSSERDWFLVAAWATVVVYLYLALAHPKISFGLFLLPLALGLIVAGTFLASAEPLAREPASRIWGAIHGVSIVAAAVAVLVGFVAGLMYLGQSRRLKHKRAPVGRLRLPSLEWLERTNSRAIVASWLMLGIGILAGMVLNRINAANQSARLYWTDPVVLSTWLMFLWLLAAVVAIAVYRPARQGRKVAYLTVASFVFLLIMLAAGLLMDSRHWGRGERGKGRGERELVIENWSLQICHYMPRGSLTNDKSPIFNGQFVVTLPPPSPFPLPPSAFPRSPGGRPC
jgi:ABC-type transport system involved in cytochrome c biogenesis permease subunit